MKTYTIAFERDGSPSTGHIVGRLQNGHRFLANHGSEGTLRELASTTKEQVGKRGWVVKGDDGRNLFTFDRRGSL